MSELEDPLMKELEGWPSVKVSQERGGKHPKLVLQANGETRKHIYPLTPSDHRSILNNVAQLRRTLVDMGARRGPILAPSATSADEILKLEASIAQLKGQLEQARQEIARLSKATPDTLSRVEQMEAGLRTLHDLLQEDHDPGCAARWRSCTCGLAEMCWDGAENVLNGNPVW